MATLPQMPQRIGSPDSLRFKFDRGLDSVTQQDSPTPHLPDGRSTPAPDIRSQAALERLLSVEDLGRLIDAAIRPTIDDPSLLLPARFAEALRLAQASLRRSLGGRRADANPRKRRIRQAMNVLEEQEELLALLWTYRNALYQG